MQNKFKTILSILKFLRAYTRGRTRTRSFFDLKFDRTDIDLDHDKYEWEITFGYEDMIMRWFSENFTKWRLDDVTSQGQGRKICLCFVPYAYTYVCRNFNDIWLSHFQIILHTKKWVEIRKINNNNKG